MDLAFNVAIGSSVQQILFVVPVLVLASFVIGAAPMDLSFKLPAAVTILLSVMIMGTLIGDGQSHWLKGAQLLALHAVLIAAILLLN
jgi:Ca2+:H+ antiporter